MHLRSNHPRTGRGVGLRTYALATGTAALLSAVVVSSAQAAAVTPPLGSAVNYAAVAATTITSTGPTVITGDLGVSPGSAVTGFPPGIVNGTIHAGDAPALTARADAHTAYTQASNEPCDVTLSNPDLGGVTLLPGVICFTSSAVGLTGTVTLDANGNPNAAWVIKTGSTLVTASNAAVKLIGGLNPCNNNNITWAIGSSATLGSATSFIGNILASASISVKTGATSTGSLYAHTGAVTMEANRISTCGGAGGLAGPALSTTPSGPVAVGGNISDSATVIGGAAPTGNVTFTLYGPGDATCTGTPVAVLPNRPLTGGTATSGNVVAATRGTYNWVAVYSGDGTNAGATSPCGSEQVIVGPRMTGRAYGLTATATALGLPLLNVAPTPDTGNVSTNASSSTTTPCRASLPGAVSANVLCANVTTDATTSTSKATASVDDTAVGIVGIPAVTVGAVKSTSTTTCDGSSGTTTIAYLKVGSVVVIAQPTAIAPNTTINVGVVKLVLNEQIAFSTPDAGLTVNAVHLTANVLGLVTANVVVASSESDIGNCA
jgi:hypothetical protein